MRVRRSRGVCGSFRRRFGIQIVEDLLVEFVHFGSRAGPRVNAVTGESGQFNLHLLAVHVGERHVHRGLGQLARDSRR